MAPRFTGRQLGALALVGAALGAWLSPGRAYAADPIPDPAGGAYVSRVSQYPVGPGITVTLSNSHGERVRTDVLTPCVYEDGRRCYWQADRRGNGAGNDFLVMSGRVFLFDLSWMGEGR